MRLVAVSQRIDTFPERKETRDALDQRLTAFLLEAGFIPVPVPNGLLKSLPGSRYHNKALDKWLTALNPHAFVLSGGNDIGQHHERDLTEGRLLDYASQHHKPLLGICHGMQMMAHWAGAGLHPVQGHVGTRHLVTGTITGKVNSFHHFSLANCPLEFEILAKSEDDEIEAIRHRSMPWEGWMWHPEREEKFAATDLHRIQELFGR